MYMVSKECPELLIYIEELKRAGFKVYVPKLFTTYCYIVKDNKVGYIEHGDRGFNFSTVHKPNLRCGTGYSVGRKITKPVIANALKTHVYAPSWASWEDMPIKYNSVEAFLAQHWQPLFEI